MKTKVVRPWMDRTLQSFVTRVNMSWAFTIPTVSPYRRHDGCRKPKLAEAKPSTTSVEILGEERLAVESVRNVVEHLQVIRKHRQEGLEVALIESVGELLC